MKIKNLNVSYGEKVIYNNFNLEIEDGLITVILGESGAGKTTLLRAIANLCEYSGEIEKPNEISMVFQNDRLVKSLTVKENILLVNKDADVTSLLNEVGLMGYENAYPKTLSGGMARRVALARAFAKIGDLALYDEPFINLDLKNKLSLINIVKQEYADNKKTLIVVTHDIKEAVLLADRIIVLKNGEVVSSIKNVKKETEEVLFKILTDKKRENSRFYFCL